MVGDNSEIQHPLRVAGHRRRRDARPRRRAGGATQVEPRGRCALTRDDLDITDATAVEAAFVERYPGRGRQLRRLDRRRRRRGGRCRGRDRGQRRPAPRNVAAAAAAALQGPGRLPLDRLRLRRQPRGALRRVRRDQPDLRLRPSKLAGELATAERPTRATSSCAPRGCSASTAATSSRRCCRSRGELRRGRWSCATRSAARPTPATSRQALVRLLDGELLRHPPHGRRRRVLLVRLRDRDLQAGRGRLPRDVDHDRHVRRGQAPRPAVLGARHRARAPDPAARLARRPGRLPRRARETEAAREGARHRRRRLHRLELRAPRARVAPRATRSWCSTSSPTPAASRRSRI